MTRSSTEPKDRIFLKGYWFSFLLKIWEKVLVKIEVKT